MVPVFIIILRSQCKILNKAGKENRFCKYEFCRRIFLKGFIFIFFEKDCGILKENERKYNLVFFIFARIFIRRADAYF